MGLWTWIPFEVAFHFVYEKSLQDFGMMVHCDYDHVLEVPSSTKHWEVCKQ
jgi:hypothetical protein